MAGGLIVLGYDVDPAKRDALAELGGVPADEAAAVFPQCERVVLSLPDSHVVARVLVGVSDVLRDGQVIVDTSTGDPADAAAQGERLARRGIEYLDATISGNSDQVRAGDVTVMAGGTSAAFERCRDLFHLCAHRSFHVGPVGSGSTMKLVTNLVLGLNRAVLAEGLAFARALGLDLAQVLSVLRNSKAYSAIMDAKGEKMVAGDFRPQAKLSQHLKDVRLILEAGAEAGAKLPFSDVHAKLLETVQAAGNGDLDNSAVIQAFTSNCPGNELAGKESLAL
jgi:3-hydroxyisobutyrate dehydrogenase-like beta-hydroxyacid dehydrogenase